MTYIKLKGYSYILLYTDESSLLGNPIFIISSITKNNSWAVVQPSTTPFCNSRNREIVKMTTKNYIFYIIHNEFPSTSLIMDNLSLCPDVSGTFPNLLFQFSVEPSPLCFPIPSSFHRLTKPRFLPVSIFSYLQIRFLSYLHVHRSLEYNQQICSFNTTASATFLYILLCNLQFLSTLY